MSKSIVICSSAAFYKHAVEIADQLEQRNLRVVLPKSARTMAKSGDFDVEKVKTWYGNDDDYDKKADFMRTHFDEIACGDEIFIINDEKHGVPGYIGPNVLMEMSLAWYQNKRIYVLHDLPENSPFEEELKGMRPIVLEGDLSRIA